MFLELRKYRIFPGKMDQYVKWMEEVIIPEQTALGVGIVGSFVGQDEGEEEDVYVWIRRWDTQAQFDAFNSTYYYTDQWRNERRPMVDAMNDLDRAVVTFLEPTASSSIQ